MSRHEAPPSKWRVSISGYSIKAGWDEDKRIVGAYPGGTERPLDVERFQRWMNDAQRICDLHNAALEGQSIAAPDALDAARYRWLRGQDYVDIACCWILPESMDAPASPEEVDAAIDAARGQP